MRLAKIPRVISFSENRWMEPWITMKIRMRAAAKNDMEKDFHKLTNNALYGKTGEIQRKITDIHLVKDRVKAAKEVDKPHCLDFRNFNEKLVCIELQMGKMLLSKSSYVGFVVLQLSNLHMLKYDIPSCQPISLACFALLCIFIAAHLMRS